MMCSNVPSLISCPTPIVDNVFWIPVKDPFDKIASEESKIHNLFAITTRLLDGSIVYSLDSVAALECLRKALKEVESDPDGFWHEVFAGIKEENREVTFFASTLKRYHKRHYSNDPLAAFIHTLQLCLLLPDEFPTVSFWRLMQDDFHFEGQILPQLTERLKSLLVDQNGSLKLTFSFLQLASLLQLGKMTKRPSSQTLQVHLGDGMRKFVLQLSLSLSETIEQIFTSFETRESLIPYFEMISSVWPEQVEHALLFTSESELLRTMIIILLESKLEDTLPTVADLFKKYSTIEDQTPRIKNLREEILKRLQKLLKSKNYKKFVGKGSLFHFESIVSLLSFFKDIPGAFKDENMSLLFELMTAFFNVAKEPDKNVCEIFTFFLFHNWDKYSELSSPCIKWLETNHENLLKILQTHELLRDIYQLLVFVLASCKKWNKKPEFHRIGLWVIEGLLESDKPEWAASLAGALESEGFFKPKQDIVRQGDVFRQLLGMSLESKDLRCSSGLIFSIKLIELRLEEMKKSIPTIKSWIDEMCRLKRSDLILVFLRKFEEASFPDECQEPWHFGVEKLFELKEYYLCRNLVTNKTEKLSKNVSLYKKYKTQTTMVLRETLRSEVVLQQEAGAIFTECSKLIYGFEIRDTQVWRLFLSYLTERNATSPSVLLTISVHDFYELPLDGPIEEQIDCWRLFLQLMKQVSHPGIISIILNIKSFKKTFESVDKRQKDQALSDLLLTSLYHVQKMRNGPILFKIAQLIEKEKSGLDPVENFSSLEAIDLGLVGIYCNYSEPFILNHCCVMMNKLLANNNFSEEKIKMLAVSTLFLCERAGPLLLTDNPIVLAIHKISSLLSKHLHDISLMIGLFNILCHFDTDSAMDIGIELFARILIMVEPSDVEKYKQRIYEKHHKAFSKRLGTSTSEKARFICRHPNYPLLINNTKI